MISDIDKGLINKVLITSTSKLFRDMTKMLEFISFANYKNIEVFSLTNGRINDQMFELQIDKYLQDMFKENEETEEMEQDYDEEYTEDDDMEF